MKIAYLFDTYPSLSETFLAREVAALRRRGLEIEIWALKAGKGAHHIPAPPRLLGGLEKHFLNAEKPAFWKQTGQNWAKKLAGRGISHIHAAWASHPAEIARIAAEKLGVSWSFAAHARDLWVEGGRLDLKLESAAFANVCTRVGAEFLRQNTQNEATRRKVFFVPHGLELGDYPIRPFQIDTQVRLLGVGRMVEKKGWYDLLDARGALAAWEPFVTLELIGGGDASLLLSNTSIEGFRLVARGARPHEDVIEAMLRSDMLVVPSKIARDGDRDGLPNVILEAAAVGLPIVATRVGAIGEFVDDETGWLCPPSEPRVFAATIRQVWANEKEARRRAQNAFERAVLDFDVRRNVETLADLIEKSVATDDSLK